MLRQRAQIVVGFELHTTQVIEASELLWFTSEAIDVSCLESGGQDSLSEDDMRGG
jgi:hypothetical protein